MTADGFRRRALRLPEAAHVFAPVPGGWGRRGATHLRLRAARAQSLRPALAAAWPRVAPRALGERITFR